MIYSSAFLLLGLASGTHAQSSATCDAEMGNTVAIGIHNELSLKLAIPNEALHAFVNAMSFMDLSAPDTVNDVDPNTQATLFNTLINLAPTDGGMNVVCMYA